MKKNIQIIIAVVVTIIGMIFVYEILEKKADDKRITDSQNFKKEYESLNGKKDSHDNIYPEVNIPDDNNIIYASEEKIVDLIKKGTAVIYFGYQECPWCRNAVPVLLEAAKETSLDEIYYLNTKDIRDSKILDANGKVVTEKKGTDGYYKIVEALSDYLLPYDGLNDDNIKRLYVPAVVFVKNGVVVLNHIDTVESQKDPYVPLNDDQRKELKEIYLSGIHKVLGDLCDDAC